MNNEGKLFNIVAYIFLALGLVVIILPLYLMLIVSFKTLPESTFNFFSFPQSFYLGNFQDVFATKGYLTSLINSVIVTVIPLVLSVVLVAMLSFSIARNRKKLYYSVVYKYIVLSIFVPFQVLMVPVVIISNKIGLMNLPGLILFYVGHSFIQGVFLFVGYIVGIPKEIDESAFMDGCGVGKLFFHMILPIMKPMIATFIVINSIWYWNDFLLPLLLLNKSNANWTLPLFQYNFNNPYLFEYNLAFASYLLAMLPLVLVYIFAQKYIIAGLTSGAVKG